MTFLPRVFLIGASLIGPLAAVSAGSPVVVGFERFGAAPDADLRGVGELLLGELGCTACHRTEGEVAARLDARAGPKLDDVGSRVRIEFLRRWLASPEGVKPGTTMPDVLAGLSAQQKPKVIEALTHFLASLRDAGEVKVAAGSVERGRQLYHRIGCIACHAPDADYPPPETAPGVRPPKPELASVPLGKLGEKYTAASLQRFLLDPLAARPSARMPQVPMNAEEAADIAAYITGDAPAAAAFQPDPQLVAEGRKQFATVGCAACHTAPGVEFVSQAKPLAQLAKSGARGCLDPQPGAGVPRYELSERQRAVVLAALEHIAEPQPLTPAQTAQRRMTALNCFACHTRDQRGGPEPGRAAYFATVEEVDLGDEGRLPPGLTGVGAKLQTEAIESTILGNGAVRPYMATRMPNFGAEHAEAFAQLFTEVDYREPTEPIPNVGRNTVGRDLIGIKGVACIACHGLNGRKSLGVPAVDLMYSPHRLRREWFHAYLIDPGALRPGTRMPSFWPKGKPASGKGNAEHQIDSLWVYLTELDQSRLPEGLEEKGEFELKPTDSPIVFRTFMQGAGMQAIAVGFPQKLHAAFDAKDVCWALAWRGAFLDAEGTWEERAAPLAEPLSKDVTTLAKESQFAAAPDAKTNARFGGYRLDGHGVPTFLYRVGAVEIEDRVEPDAAGRTLRRTLKLRGKGPLFFHVAAGEKIVSGAASPVTFDAQGGATITTEITW